MGAAFDMGPIPKRNLVDSETVRELVVPQFPEWADLDIRPVPSQGWDNQTFRLGSTMSVRLPTAAEYALAVAKEQQWLPILAPALPLEIPVPLAQGEPTAGFPHDWSVYPWIEGVKLDPERIANPSHVAADLARFLGALQQVDPTDGPGPGTHNWFRGGPLTTFASTVRDALEALGGLVDRERVVAVWDAALEAEVGPCGSRSPTVPTRSRAAAKDPAPWQSSTVSSPEVLVEPGLAE